MCRQPRKGLTLLEVTIACVALILLCGQIVPAAREARSDAQQTLCAQRLGNLARACQAYAAQDPTELVLPIGAANSSTPPYTTYYGFGGKSGRGQSVSGSLADSAFSGGNRMNAALRPLNHLISKQPIPTPPSSGYGTNWSSDARLKLDEYYCPADRGFPGMHISGWRTRGTSSYTYFGTSYITNPLFAMTVNEPHLYSNALMYRAQSAIPNPGNTIMLWENAALFAIFAANSELNQHNCYWPFPQAQMQANGWHGEPFHFNVAMADGSVRYVEIKGYGRDPGIPQFGCTLYPCDCYVIRGLGWQLDTWPAPPILTTKMTGTPQHILTQIGSGSTYTVVD